MLQGFCSNSLLRQFYCTITYVPSTSQFTYTSLLRMAESGSWGKGGDGSSRKKRAWRKPREPPTPSLGAEEKASKSLKLVRGASSGEALSSATPRAVAAPPLAGSAAVEAVISSRDGEDTVEKLVVLGADKEMSREVSHDQEPPLKSPVTINGSIMEGGGQILRISMTLSCLLSRPIHIHRIRAGRDKPGLRPQHMTGLRLLADLCGGTLAGDEVGSCEVTFHPGELAGGRFTADTKTAGSICLLLQSALPVLLFTATPSTVTLKGGTNADMAPPIDYFQKVFFPVASKFGINFDCQLRRRGFYPKGRGEVVYSTAPVRVLSPVALVDRGRLVEVHIHAFVAGNVPKKAGHAMVKSARRVLSQYLSTTEEKDVSIRESVVAETFDAAFGNGSGIILTAHTSSGNILAGSANGSRSQMPEDTGKAAAEDLAKDLASGGCVDQYLQDQLIILMSVADGRSSVKTGPLTLHTRTAMNIVEIMTAGKAKFEVEEMGDNTNVIHCGGIGMKL